MSNPTFAECFCAKNNIPREEFARMVFNRALYPRTHLVKWLLPLFGRQYFAADFDLIYSVASLTRLRDFDIEVDRFNEHPGNHGWLRRTICLRVSTGRLKKLMRQTIPRSIESAASGVVDDDQDNTLVPFDLKGREQAASDGRDLPLTSDR
jgi:hypothetical protein